MKTPDTKSDDPAGCVERLVVRLPSKERGCDGKIDISGKYTRKVDSFSRKHGKPFGAYRCPHCNGVHMTSKLTAEKRKQYGPLLYVSSHNDQVEARRK